MAKKFRIFADVSAGSLFFDGSRVQPAPLGGKVLASINPNFSDRIRMVRTDLFARDGVTPRRIFKGLKEGRIKNEAGQILANEGFTTQQIVDYINDQANKKANEIDFQKEGTLVGGGTTINFTGGGVGSLSVSGDIATVGIASTVPVSNIVGLITSGQIQSIAGSQITGNINSTQLSPHITGLGGVNFTLGDSDATPAFNLSDAHSYPIGVGTTGGYVGTGVTLFNFKGSGVSTVTPVSSGITTIFIEGGSAGNPVTSGILTSGNSTLRLTLQDATTVDIDVNALNNVSPVSLAASTAYFYLNTGNQLANNEHNLDNGVVFYGTPVRKGNEIVFSIPGNSTHVGIWNGGVGVTGSDNVRNKSNWSMKWQYNHNRTDWEAATASHGATGVELPKDIQVDNGTYYVRVDHATEKLQLWEASGTGDWLLSESNVGVGTTSTYIYFSRGGDDTGGSYLPSVSTVRGQDFTLRSYTDSDRPSSSSFYDGTKTNDVWKSNRALKAGLKVKFTVPTTAGNQYWATNFEGNEDLGSGENNAYQAGEMTWRLTNQERFTAHEDATLNTNYTAIDGSTSLPLPGRNISWRYNADNTWDLFDEDTDEVILTGDDTLSGDMYPHLLAVNNSEDVLSDYVQYEWEWNKAAWFMEYRDWESGHNANTWLILSANGYALQEATTALISNNGFYYIGSALYNVTWGQKMRPGQEFIWTQLAINQHGATKNNMKIGVLDSTKRDYSFQIRFDRTGKPKAQGEQDGAFTLAAGIDENTVLAGTSMRMQYEYGTNKLVVYSVNAGVRTKIATSNTALDGNPIFISLGGDSTRLPTVQGIEVYGWEVAHQGVGHYNPWNNWRIGSFPENQALGGVGIHSTGGVLAYKADQVWRHKDGIPAGYKMHWTLPATQANTQIGQWASSNASSGLTNVENNDSYFDWSWQTNTSEEIESLKGWTFNTSNSNYSATKWTDPSPGNTKFSIRYASNNTIDIYDESNGAVIATKDVNGDGNPIYISWVAGGATSNQAQMQDDFFGGGDVGIALTSASV